MLSIEIKINNRIREVLEMENVTKDFLDPYHTMNDKSFDRILFVGEGRLQKKITEDGYDLYRINGTYFITHKPEDGHLKLAEKAIKAKITKALFME